MLGVAPLAYLGLVWVGLVPERYVRIERPFVSLIAALALAFITLRLLQLTSRGTRRWLTELLLTTSALAAALAAMGLSLGRPLDRLAVLIAVDKSRSMDLVPDAVGRIRTELQVAELSMREDDRIGVLSFASQAATLDPLRPRSRLPAPQEVEIGRDGTDIGAAIRRALAEVPADSAARIVILSDGVATRGDALDAAAAAVAADVPVDVVPLDQRVVPDVRVVSVRTPSRASEGEAIGLRVVTHATQDSEIEIEIHKDGERTQRGRVKVRAGEDVVHLREEAPGPGLRRFDVKITAVDPTHDEAPEDNTGSAFVRVRGPAAALILEGDVGQAEPLAAALRNAAFRVDVGSATTTPADIAGLAAYDVVVLSDIPARLLSQGQLDAIGSYVRDLGGGLLLMGGDRSLGPGGFGKTPVEEVSPVSFDLKQERKRATLAEVIIIDYSGSMAASAGKHSKLELANEASARSAELLGTGDRLGVMHVDTAVTWTVPLGPLTDKAAITKKIRDVKPGGGGIYIDISLKEAYAALRSEKVALKHVLLFSDGGDAEQKTDAFNLIQAAKVSGITTSVVALGRGSDVPALERMSKIGDGRFYLIEDASRLPAVFAQETILAARSAINEVRFTPAERLRAAPTRGVDLSAMPSLNGYVVTIPKGRAQVLLEGPEADPLLATWSVGIGRSAVFTSDYKDRWGSAWTHWGGAQQLFAQLARDITRAGDDPRVRLEADAGGGELHVRATLVDDDGRAESFRRLKVRVAGPEGYQQEVALEATGAGAYAARVPIDVPGPYIATGIDELSKEPVGTTGAVLSFGDELRPTGTDRALLARIAALTGGKERDTLAGLFHDRVSRRFAYRAIDDLLIWVAALTLLLGVGARRLAVPTWLAALPARLRRRRARAARPTEDSPGGGTLGALLGRKAKADAGLTPRRGEPDASVSVSNYAPPQPPSAPRAAPAYQPRAAPHPRAAPTATSGARVTPGAPPAAVTPGGAPQGTSAAPGAPAAPSRQLSAAEILLQRRRRR
ncbi:MAG: VWA domain-containing protein [Polyangiaceae bacterium]|nr:VWA domain-containing protein [Polyangiaceae bacterium]MCW5790625.1 VWA domain-containing protein [Polyangiaceae bacterium]